MFANDVTNKGLNSKIYKQIMCSKSLEQTTQLMGRRSKYTFLFFFFNFYYYLEYNCFTMLCWFLPCINMSPSCINTSPPSRTSFLHPSYPASRPPLEAVTEHWPRSLCPGADPAGRLCLHVEARVSQWPCVLEQTPLAVCVCTWKRACLSGTVSFTPPSPFPPASTSLLSMSASLLLPPNRFISSSFLDSIYIC